MSAPTATAAHHGHDDNKFQIYVQIAMLLAVITGACPTCQQPVELPDAAPT